jgi:hypothetical protein
MCATPLYASAVRQASSATLSTWLLPILMADLDETGLVLALAERFHDAVDAIAWQAEDGVHAPVVSRESSCGTTHHQVVRL